MRTDMTRMYGFLTLLLGGMLWGTALQAQSLKEVADLNDKVGLPLTLYGAQPEAVTVNHYRYYKGDTAILYRKTHRFDTSGRALYKLEHYHKTTGAIGADGPFLERRYRMQYDTVSQRMRESLSVFSPKEETPTTEFLQTVFRRYSAVRDSSLAYSTIWRDNDYEIIKEDTITYNEKGLTTKVLTYDYRGNTALFEDQFIYFKRGKRRNKVKKWRMYSKWNTVNWRGRVVERKTRRRYYRYRYNCRGQLRKIKGTYYRADFLKTFSYDRDHQLEEVITKETRRRTASDIEREKTGKKYVDHLKVTTQRFDSLGRPTFETIVEDDFKRKHVEVRYNKHGIDVEDYYLRDAKYKEVKHYYKQGKEHERVIYQFDGEGHQRYTTRITYDANERPVQSIHADRDHEIDRIIYTYDAQGNLREQVTYKFGKKYQYTLYQYTYFSN